MQFRYVLSYNQQINNLCPPSLSDTSATGFEPKLPHAVFLNGYFAGMMKDDQLQGEVPPGSYSLRVQFGGQIPIGKKGKSIDMSLSSTEQVEVPPTGEVVCEFHDRERLWNILFDIDLILRVVSWFVQMPPLYKILSDVFLSYESRD